MTYRPATAAESYRRVLRGDDPRLALGDFLDDWRRTPAARRMELVHDPLDGTGPTGELHRWAAFFAATVDQLSAESQKDPPSWTSQPLKEHVLRWLDSWRDGAAESIGDALIAASMSAHSAEAIVTFDRGFPAADWAVLTGPRRDAPRDDPH